MTNKYVSEALQRVAGEFDRFLDGVKICDPAIGSGAFPMGLLLEIYTCKLALRALGEAVNHADLKLSIIQNSIYGVDIERGAVDIARLRFWLSLVVDEDRPRPLPNLDYKIVVGNSLVSKLDGEVLTLDWKLKGTIGAEQEIVKLSAQLTQKQRAFFTASGDKAALQREIRDLKIDLLSAQIDLDRRKVLAQLPSTSMFGLSAKDQKKTVELQATIQGLDATLRKLRSLREDPARPLPYFDWRLDFPEVLNPHVSEGAGFDIVIGNPPYVQLARLRDEADREAFSRYATYERTGDLYCLFYEQSVRLLKPNGVLSFITSNSWLQTQYGQSLRRFFVEQTDPLALLNFVDTQLFETATVETNILMVRRADCRFQMQATSVTSDYNPKTPLAGYVTGHAFTLTELPEAGWAIGDAAGSALKKKFERVGKKLEEWPVEIYRGVTTGYNPAFIIQNEDIFKRLSKVAPNLIQPTLRGRDLRRYSYTFSKQWLIFTRRGIYIDRHPEIKNHLFEHYEQLRPRNNGEAVGRKAGNYQWFEIQDNTAYFEEFHKPKIIWGELSDEAKFTFDDEGHYVEATVFMMTGGSLKYLLAVLNSKAGQWYFEQITTTSGMGTNRWKKYKIEQLPVPVPTPSQEQTLTELVEKVLAGKRQNHDTTALEAEIDLRVYQLYGLSYAEVKLIEQGFGLSEAEYEAASTPNPLKGAFPA